jgi:hypothetical protein
MARKTAPKISTSSASITLNDLANLILQENKNLDFKEALNQEISEEDIYKLQNKSNITKRASGNVRKNITKNAPGKKQKRENDFVDDVVAKLFGQGSVDKMTKNPKSGYNMIKEKFKNIFTGGKDISNKISTSIFNDGDKEEVTRSDSPDQERASNKIDDLILSTTIIKNKIDDLDDNLEKVEDKLDDLSNAVNKTSSNYPDLSAKIDKIYDRLSVKSITIEEGGEKKYFAYDPLGPENKQVKRITESGKVGGFASKSDANRVLTKASYMQFDKKSESEEVKKENNTETPQPQQAKRTDRIPRSDIRKIGEILTIVKEINKKINSKEKEKKDKDKKPENTFAEDIFANLFGQDKVDKANKNKNSGYNLIKNMFSKKDPKNIEGSGKSEEKAADLLEEQIKKTNQADKVSKNADIAKTAAEESNALKAASTASKAESAGLVAAEGGGAAAAVEGGAALAGGETALAALGPVGLAVGAGLMLASKSKDGGDDKDKEVDTGYHYEKSNEGTSVAKIEGKESELSGKVVHRREGSHTATGSDIEDFGSGTPAVLHGKEGVITERRLNELKSQTADDVASEKNDNMDDIHDKLDALQSSIDQSKASGIIKSQTPMVLPPAATDARLKLTNSETSISTYTASIFDHPVIHPGLFKM